MDDRFNELSIMSDDQLASLEDEHGSEVISDIISLGEDKKIVSYKLESAIKRNILNSCHEPHNVNVAIGAAVPALGRILMSQFKNRDDITLFYTDTDSAYVQGPLPAELVSDTELGKFKLEYIAKRAVFLGPKFYALELEDGRLIFKVKGLNKSAGALTMDDFIALLKRDSRLERHQTKWFRDMETGSITLKDQLYTMKVSEAKRELVYSDDGILTHTKPLIL